MLLPCLAALLPPLLVLLLVFAPQSARRIEVLACHVEFVLLPLQVFPLSKQLLFECRQLVQALLEVLLELEDLMGLLRSISRRRLMLLRHAGFVVTDDLVEQPSVEPLKLPGPMDDLLFGYLPTCLKLLLGQAEALLQLLALCFSLG